MGHHTLFHICAQTQRILSPLLDITPLPLPPRKCLLCELTIYNRATW